MSSPNPASLRDLYNPPTSPWSFIPITPAPPSPSAFKTKPSSVPQRHFSHTQSRHIDVDLDGARTLAHNLAIAALAQYSSTAVAMPWEVGKTLLQVQWVPRYASSGKSDMHEEEDEAEMSDSSIDNDNSYFTDPDVASPSRHAQAPLRQADEQGYILRKSVLEESTKPEYIIPVGSADGVWGMIKRVGRFRGEGWLSLWKGLLTSFITDVLSVNMQPLLHNALQSLFLPNLTPFQQPPLLLPVVSHMLTGFILSPLDLIRTRLIVQSSLGRHRTYTGPLDAASKILQQEGGLRGMYLHPHLLYPTVLDSTLRPLVSLGLPNLLASYLGPHVSPETSPIFWAFAELAGGCAGLLVTLPIETVKRRLQVQVRGGAKPIKACVETRPAPYNGIVDAMWHILTEERSDLPISRSVGRRRKRRGKGKVREGDEIDVEEEGWLRNTGIGQLYRGLGMRLAASVVVLLLGAFTGQERDAGWAEL